MFLRIDSMEERGTIENKRKGFFREETEVETRTCGTDFPRMQTKILLKMMKTNKQTEENNEVKCTQESDGRPSLFCPGAAALSSVLYVPGWKSCLPSGFSASMQSNGFRYGLSCIDATLICSCPLFSPTPLPTLFVFSLFPSGFSFCFHLLYTHLIHLDSTREKT